MLGLQCGQGHSRQNRPLERKGNVPATRLVQIQNRSGVARAVVSILIILPTFKAVLAALQAISTCRAHLPQQIQNKQFRAGDRYSARKNKLFLRHRCCLLTAATLPSWLKHLLSPALRGVQAAGPGGLCSPLPSARSSSEPHRAWDAEERGGAGPCHHRSPSLVTASSRPQQRQPQKAA